MEWVLRSPQIHSIFSTLGYACGDSYHVNENCNVALEAILRNILSDDKYLRTYRRSISFGQNIKKDLIPLLIHAKEDKTIELLTKILVNLTIPIDCLLSVDIISKNDFGRHTIFEMNNLLASAKVAFTDHRATKAVIDFLRKNLDSDQKTKLLPEKCSNVSNSLLLLRNILHIPIGKDVHCQSYSGQPHSVQNQILWNIFSQSIDKVFIKLMSIPDARCWAVTLVQIIALLYKDQNIGKLSKLHNIWLESTLSESSEDNESNTPPERGSDDSSPNLTSEPPSDSSDNSSKSNDKFNLDKCEWQDSSGNTHRNEKHGQMPVEDDKHNDAECKNNTVENKVDDSMAFDHDTAESSTSGIHSVQTIPTDKKVPKKMGNSETSKYVRQIEHRESNSTSSNDDLPSKKPVHRKPHNPKQRVNTKARLGSTLQERKRKKIVKRSKSSIINIHGLTQKLPTDDDIASVLTEFTVDFLLKGYNSLVHSLHIEMLTNNELEFDTSHFFWLLTYFLKIATQLELGFENVGSVLSYDIASYLTAEGVNLCEQFELAIKVHKNSMAPTTRRLHLVVTAIREFVQAIEEYKKSSNMSQANRELLVNLQIKMCETEELRTLFVLLIRYYNPECQPKQYLQDLITTNHLLLTFMDHVMRLPEYKGSASMACHLKQFATPEIMHQYGLLLENYSRNGAFVNDCIFTVLHHVGGDLNALGTMFQPNILKTFASITESGFELCENWDDLVQYALNKYTKKPIKLQSAANFPFNENTCDDDFLKLIGIAPSGAQEFNDMEVKIKLAERIATHDSSKERWTSDEISSLSWMYMQCNSRPDVIGELMKLLKEDGIDKSKDAVIRELFKQNIINKDKYKKHTKVGSDKQSNQDTRDDDIAKLCMQLGTDGKRDFLDWVQRVLLETCHAKIYLDTMKMDQHAAGQSKLLNFELFKKKGDMPVMSPVSYHSLSLNQSVPFVPWNCQQAAICKDLKFLQLLHKLGFHMPVDSGKVFIRIPHFWTADYMYNIAGKISAIDTSKLKFSVNEFAQTSATKPAPENTMYTYVESGPTMYHETDHCYQVHKQTYFATMVNFTPMPGCSYNTDASEIDNSNWLKMVQKSHEIKLTLSAASSAEETESAVSPPPPTAVPEAPPPAAGYATFVTSSLMAGSLVAGCDGAPLLMPTIMTVKQEIATFTVHHDETECCNNSVCETASVASDLTRMYVSDEDEKSDEYDEPEPGEALLKVDAELDDRESDSASETCSVPRKKQRLNFSTPF